MSAAAEFVKFVAEYRDSINVPGSSIDQILARSIAIIETQGAELERVKIDPVTRLPGRYASEATARRVWDRAVRTGGSVGVLMIDVDNFKAANDNWGHPYGDGVLRQVAMEIVEATRSEEFVGRWGGDEFIVFVERADVKALTDVAARINERVNHYTPVTVSIGGSLEVDNDLGLDDITLRADSNLLLVKKAGRNASRIS